MIYFLLLLSCALGAKEEPEKLCSRWEKQAKGLRCNNPRYAVFCADAYAKACDSASGEEHAEQNDGAVECGDVPCENADDPDICPKWDKQDVQAYCTSPEALRMKYCCQLTKDKCRDFKLETTTTTPATAKEATKRRPATTQAPKPTANDNYRSCCQANGVPQACLAICSYTPADTALCDSSSNCESYFMIGTYCGNNNGDNSGCCQSVGVPAKCLKFCNANARFIDVGNLQHLSSHRSCLENSEGPRKCAYEAYQRTGPNWEVRSFPQQRKFPQIVKNIVANQPACKRRG